MVGSLVLRLRFDPVLIRGLSRTPRLRPTVFRADLLRARPPPFDSFMVSSSAHSARQTTGAARLGHLPRCYPSVRPAPYLCVYSALTLARRPVGAASMVGAVSSARIRRPGRDAGVPVRSPRRTSAPRAKLPLSIHVRSGPFSSCCAALLAVAPLVHGIRPTSPRSRTRLLVSPVPSSPPGATVGPASPIFTPRCPVLLSTARRLLNQP